jgi:hypothetical protein
MEESKTENVEEKKEQEVVQKEEVIQDNPGWVDLAIGKVVSRKFLVFAIATVLLVTSHLSVDWWGYLACAYVGIQGFADIVEKIKSKE